VGATVAVEEVEVARSATSATGSGISPGSVVKRRTAATSVTARVTSPGTAARKRTPATTVTKLVTSSRTAPTLAPRPATSAVAWVTYSEIAPPSNSEEISRPASCNHLICPKIMKSEKSFMKFSNS